MHVHKGCLFPSSPFSGILLADGWLREENRHDDAYTSGERAYVCARSLRFCCEPLQLSKRLCDGARFSDGCSERFPDALPEHGLMCSRLAVQPLCAKEHKQEAVHTLR
uniref:Uncharacterized protein n=1 Tax=Anopheles funestus TaxID=62324 RepID=A0A182S370_ANOFN